ncbi:Proteolipid membrane potential modulator family-containing protein [Strongyloides ratti]|uniref:Proteolipid membrane potential modulator family-containing protein n=1 Tax=Strongyloides ratti TaxID=34506 RepID=A0A090L5Y9_STRRB|nr:Proteolipid membrane potential modulator family-containing protein [Strongyloides ratti]CEF63542.1 Proteolipid membrane potential modulator family-containing protein [Strongyloides ratti]
MVQSCFIGFLLLPVAIFLPPLAIIIDKGCGSHLFVNCILTAFFLIPGIINALLVLYCFESTNYDEKDNINQGANINKTINQKLKNYNDAKSIIIV